jgi:Putative metal-binding motif
MAMSAAVLFCMWGAPGAGAAPINDNFANRLDLQVGVADTRGNSDATVEEDERLTAKDLVGFSCEKDGTEGPEGVPMTHTLWWGFIGTGGPVTVSTRGSTVDTVLAIYEAGSSTLIGCNDDLHPIDHTQPNLHYNVDSEVFFETVEGQEYYIQVGACTPVPPETCGAEVGNVTLRVSAPPAHDKRSGATPIEAGSPLASDNTGATLDPGENAICGKSPYAKTVWFRYIAPAPGTMVVSASGFDTVLAVYRANSTAPLACNDDAVEGESGPSRVPAISPAEDPLYLQAGEYLIQIGGYHDPGFSTVAADNGPLQLQLSFEEDLDVDGDGAARGLDCDDGNPVIHPGAPEAVNDEVDENCDGLKAFDRDGDEFLAPPLGGDCDDQSPLAHPGAKEIKGNQVDENCDGVVAARRLLKPDFEVGSFRYEGADPHTWIREVVVGSVPKGAEIKLRCRGGCPFRRIGPIKIHQARGKRVVAHGFRVDPGATLEVRVTKPEWIGRAGIFVFPETKPRKDLERCISPTGALRACARE